MRIIVLTGMDGARLKHLPENALVDEVIVKGSSSVQLVETIRAWEQARGPAAVWVPRAVIIDRELVRDLGGDIGARAAKFGPKAFLRSGPKNIAILVAQAHGGIGFVLAFLDMVDVVLARAQCAIAAAGAGGSRTSRAILAERFVRVDALARIEAVGE